ncbi:S8 family serine peptidase [soil metagenome]
MLVAALVAGALAAPAPGAGAQGTPGKGNAAKREYLVLYKDHASRASAHRAVQEAGGAIVDENEAIGLAKVSTRNGAFLSDVASQEALYGAARDEAIGKLRPADRAKRNDVERLTRFRTASKGPGPRAAARQRGPEPLAPRQWDMRMMHATARGSYAIEKGSKKVLIGIMDTGVAARHPDIRPNFNARLSRNFTHDIPLIDGPCAEDPDHSCKDPATVDENGHGTHVAGTIGSPINHFGMAGVAPNVTLVNIRAGQDSGYFFLKPTVDALTYAGRRRIDAVNMSYYIDPWLYNCRHNPADSPAAKMQQQTIIRATQRAADYARSRGVTLISASGNDHTDLCHPKFDDTSPDFPPGAAYPRHVTNRCLDMPTEARGVLAINALGPSGRKSYYSNYGVEQSTVAAPGGDYYDFPGTKRTERARNLVLAPYPRALAVAADEIGPHGKPNTPFVVRDCKGKPDGTRRCAYYQYLQGTSMASPHAVGVAALIVSKYGALTGGRYGIRMRPSAVQRTLQRTARNHACPRRNPYVYPDPIPAEYTAFCQGNARFNGFYGHGIADALRAVTRR